MTRARDNADLGDSYGTIGSGVTFPAGHVLNIVQALNSTFDTVSGDTGADQDDWFSCAINLSSSSSKVLIHATACVGHAHSYTGYWGLKRGATVIWPTVDNTGSNTSTVRGVAFRQESNTGGMQYATPTRNVQYLDAPGTAGSVTYYIFLAQSGGVLYRNRSTNSTGTGDSDNSSKGTSTLILYEIAG